MRNIRYASLVLAVGLIAAIIAFTQVFVVSSNAENNTRSYLGMGDLHVAESQQGSIPVTGAQASRQSYVGMGDLRLLDASQAAPASTLKNRYVGMGDLLLFDASQSGDLVVPVTGTEMKVAPVFNAAGSVISDPTGTLFGARQSGDLVVPVTGTEMKVAPMFDVTGAVVSDPTGTMLSGNNP